MYPMTPATLANPRKLILAAAIISAFAAGTAQAAAESKGQAATPAAQALEQTTVHHWGWANPRIALMIERTGQALVDVLERADQALAGQQPVLAANNLEYADKLAQVIELQMPYVQLKDRLETAKGKLEAGATHDFFDDLAPVYASIDDLTLVAPGLGGQIKVKVQKAEDLARAGKQGVAFSQVDEALDHVIATRVYIPILYVQGQIDAARKALTARDIKGAHKAVEKAVNSLVVVLTGDGAGGSVDLSSGKPGQ